MILLLLVVIALVAWALHLMQEALQQKEFSLMLAGFLVSASAVAMIGVYLLMDNCVGYLAQSHRVPTLATQLSDPITTLIQEDQITRQPEEAVLLNSPS